MSAPEIPAPQGSEMDYRATDDDEEFVRRHAAMCGSALGGLSHLAWLRQGVGYGWWGDVDEEIGAPILVLKKDELPFTTMAAFLHAQGRFPSIKHAKRQGWNKPVELGTYRFGTYIYRIE